MFFNTNHPNVSAQKAKYPLTFEDKKLYFEEWHDLSDIEDFESNSFDLATPKGEWTSPVVREAMSRQVSKEIQFKCLWARICKLFLAIFFLLALEKFSQFYHPRLRVSRELLRENSYLGLIFTSISNAGEYILEKICSHGRHTLWVFGGFICLDLFKLARPQDQCRDLPLTSRQRELIGLEPLRDTEEKKSSIENLVFEGKHSANKFSVPSRVPKYQRMNRLSESLRNKSSTFDVDDSEIDLRDTIPERTNLERS